MDWFRALSTAGALSSQGPGSIWLLTLLMLAIQAFLAFISICIQASNGVGLLNSAYQAAVAFGFLAVFATIGQLWFIFKEFRDSKSEGDGTATAQSNVVVTQQHDAPFSES